MILRESGWGKANFSFVMKLVFHYENLKRERERNQKTPAVWVLRITVGTRNPYKPGIMYWW